MKTSHGGFGVVSAAARWALERAHRHSSLRPSLCRWRIGHQLFIVLDQMLLAAVAVLDRALAEGDWVRAERSFDRLAQLFLASTAVLRHTGDFAPGVYERLVARDMVDFYPTPGMSGGNMLDHIMLVKAMRALVHRHGEVIRLAPIPVYDAYLRFEHARAAALDGHRHVCVWSAGNRRSLASNIEEPAGIKIARLDERRRRDLQVSPAGNKGEVHRAKVEAPGRPLNAAFPPSPARCPITRLRSFILRLIRAGHTSRRD
jgi:hypothetical protein